MIPEPLLSHLVLMARMLPPGAIAQISASIERGGLADGSVLEAGATSESTGLIEQMVSDCRGAKGCSPEEVASALRVANASVRAQQAEQSLEVVWTGPVSSGVPVRRIDQVLYQIIENAQRRLLVVSYAVYRVPRILRAVNAAASRGVRVELVLEFEGHAGEQEWNPLTALGQLDRRVRVFEWPRASRPTLTGGRHGMIHAKCAVADSRVAVVSSANLTDYALDANMELGLRIEGAPIASEIDRHFRALMDEGVLQLHASR